MACFIIGIVFLLLGAGVAVLVHPAIVYASASPGVAFGTMAEGILFYLGQWLSFWLLLLAAILFLAAWRQTPALFTPLPKWSLVFPVLCGLFLLHFLIFTMPVAANEMTWNKGDIGIAACIRALRDR